MWWSYLQHIGYLFWSNWSWILLSFDILFFFILKLLLCALKSPFNTVLICNIQRRPCAASLLTDFTTSIVCCRLLFLPLTITVLDTGLSYAGEAFKFFQCGGAEAPRSFAWCWLCLWRDRKFSSNVNILLFHKYAWLWKYSGRFLLLSLYQINQNSTF